MQHERPEVFLEVVEVAVLVKEPMALLNAKCGDDTVDSLAYRNAPAAQRSREEAKNKCNSKNKSLDSHSRLIECPGLCSIFLERNKGQL